MNDFQQFVVDLAQLNGRHRHIATYKIALDVNNVYIVCTMSSRLVHYMYIVSVYNIVYMENT